MSVFDPGDLLAVAARPRERPSRLSAARKRRRGDAQRRRLD